MHIWTIGVKDPDNLYSNLVLLMIVCKEGLGTAFTFIITGTYPDGIYISPVWFRLWMNRGISIYFTGGCLQYFRFDPFCQAKHVDCSHHRCFNSFDGIVLIMYGRRRTGQVVDLIYLHIVGSCNIVSDQFKIWVFKQVGNVCFGSGEEIIQAEYFIPFLKQSLA